MNRRTRDQYEAELTRLTRLVEEAETTKRDALARQAKVQQAQQAAALKHAREVGDMTGFDRGYKTAKARYQTGFWGWVLGLFD